MQQKKWKALIPVAGLLAALLFMLWPLSFDGADQSEYGVLVTWIEVSVANGMPRQDSQDYVFAADSPEYRAIAALLEKATYHRCLATWLNNKVIQGEGRNTLYLTFGTTDVSLPGGAEIRVNGDVYKMGYVGTHRVQTLMDSVLEILKSSPSSED